MAGEITVPILPCQSIDDTLVFYRALGFAVTYQQAKPNVYAVVEREGIILHFFAMSALKPADSYSTCFILSPDVEGLRQAFVNGLRQHYGKLPVAGIPRITPMRDKSGGTRGFNLIDPGGNWIRIAQKIDTVTSDSATPKAPLTKLERAIHAADLLAESKGDFAAAAAMLDSALEANPSASAVEKARALIARAGLAINLGDQPLAKRLLTEMRQLPLLEGERAALAAEFQTAADLEQMLL